MGHQHITYSSVNIPPLPQIERWWVGGAVLGPSEYKAEYRSRKPDVWNIEQYPPDNKYMSPNLLQPHTSAHFSGAGYAKKVRSEASSIFPSWKDAWLSETKRSFSQTAVGEKDSLTFSHDLGIKPESWGYARQETWFCPLYARKESMLEEKVYEYEDSFRIVPSKESISRPMKTEFQGAYKGTQPRQPSNLPNVVSQLQQYETILAPNMYNTSAATIGSNLPLIL
ncbi:uncharacterized protein LOC135941840 [Cloeon dipterum]|uniref:uncharacterized protein LOC135941840 n=1 Tax=Cloeon dipterum TaxID=197152 RepID=UPI0032207E24